MRKRGSEGAGGKDPVSDRRRSFDIRAGNPVSQLQRHNNDAAEAQQCESGAIAAKATAQCRHDSPHGRAINQKRMRRLPFSVYAWSNSHGGATWRNSDVVHQWLTATGQTRCGGCRCRPEQSLPAILGQWKDLISWRTCIRRYPGISLADLA